jgi:hypothetical protein
MQKNYPFATYLTNKSNIGMFNNGTIHYNITLPTKLNEDNQIEDIEKFKQIHKLAIKMIQWMEPFLIAVYNTPDPLANYSDSNYILSKSSQRCAISRYISIGTFDTDTMKSGKILTVPVTYFDKCTNWWYNKFHMNSGYNKLDSVGLDINYNKYQNHGIEIRFFDYIPNQILVKESFEFIIYLMDYVYDLYDKNSDISNPIYDTLWNDLVCNIMIHGKKYSMIDSEIIFYNKLFNIDIGTSNISIKEYYYLIYDFLQFKYISSGKFSSLVL